MAHPFTSSDVSRYAPDHFHFVSVIFIIFSHQTLSPANYPSFLPESPRFLISKDRAEEAFDILVKYHAEGDRDSVFARAEMAQIEATIKIEMESAKQSSMGLIRTPGMRRRILVSGFLGLFTQWSGNTLIS
jgi:Sugar (and other) transporter